MMVGNYHSHPQHPSRREQYTNSGGSSSNDSLDYTLPMPSDREDRPALHHSHSTASLIDSIERRTQRTYRYGIGLVCIGATLNWLGFAQVYGTHFIEPLRYFGITCVLTGSFCVCLAMCRWLGRPISVSGHHVSNLDEERANGDVHVINVPVPMYVPSLHEEYRSQKPPEYEQIVAGEPPSYHEAIKLSPGAFFTPSPNGALASVDTEGGRYYVSQQLASSASFQESPSHHNLHHHSNLASNDLSRALLLDHQDNVSICGSGAPTPTPSHPTPSHYQPHLSFRSNNNTSIDGSDPPPAYEPSPRPSITSCSSIAPLIPTSTSRFELPPSFSVRRMFGGIGINPSSTTSNSSPNSPNCSPTRRVNNNYSSNNNNNSLSDHLHDQIILEGSSTYLQQQSSYVPNTQHDNTHDLSADSVNGNVNIV